MAELTLTASVIKGTDKYTISLFSDAEGQPLVYLSDDAHGDVTLPLSVLHQLTDLLPRHIDPHTQQSSTQ